VKENRQRWLDLVRQVEGGFCQLEGDAGGATNFGVTQAVLAAWRRQPVTVEDVQRLQWTEACAIFSARYWGTVAGDRLPPGLDLAVADMAVHSGVRQAARTLQRVLGCKPDGHVGPATLEAARRAKHPDILIAFCDARMAFLQRLPGWTRFGRGWRSRVEQVQAAALDLAKVQAGEKPEPIAVAKNRINLQAATAAIGAVVAAGPGIKDAYVSTTTATAPLTELAAWLPTAIGIGVAALTLLMLARRARLLAQQQ
jgi:lysozyme family protein